MGSLTSMRSPSTSSFTRVNASRVLCRLPRGTARLGVFFLIDMTLAVDFRFTGALTPGFMARFLFVAPRRVRAIGIARPNSPPAGGKNDIRAAASVPFHNPRTSFNVLRVERCSAAGVTAGIPSVPRCLDAVSRWAFAPDMNEQTTIVSIQGKTLSPTNLQRA